LRSKRSFNEGAIQTHNPNYRQWVKKQPKKKQPNKQNKTGVRGNRVIHGTGKKSKKPRDMKPGKMLGNAVQQHNFAVSD